MMKSPSLLHQIISPAEYFCPISSECSTNMYRLTAPHRTVYQPYTVTAMVQSPEALQYGIRDGF
ncbi:hypothetical protein BDZ89DRAFT_343605 [Hymenopellis radicata]|nr:hypothetical protein BDZ89DRAFT_343605 [Hymenopellis radicata]